MGMQMVFLGENLPHIHQTAYQKSVSFADAIFTTQEIIAQYMRGGSKVYMHLYDLQKGFDTVEYPILLKGLYKVGVNGKIWRLLKRLVHGRFRKS